MGEISPLNQYLKMYWANQWNLIDICDGVLCRKWVTPDGEIDSWMIILPVDLRPLVLQELHNTKSAGHMGETQTLDRIKMR